MPYISRGSAPDGSKLLAVDGVWDRDTGDRLRKVFDLDPNAS